MKKIAITMLLFLACVTARSSYSSYSFSVHEGLSNPTAYNVVKDANGFIWIATKQGIDMYNGLNFKHYGLFGHNYRSIMDGVQIQIYRSFDNRLWAFNDAGRIFLYTIPSDNFQPFVNLRDFGLEEQLFCLNQKGTRLFAGVAHGIVELSIESGKMMSYKKDMPQVNMLIVNEDGSMLAGTVDGLYDVSEDLKTATRRENTQGLPIQTLFVDPSNDVLWIGSDGRGLWRYTNGQLQQLGNDGYTVRSITQLNDQQLLVAVDGLGVYSVNNDGTGLERFATNLDDEGRHIVSNSVYSILNDEGNIWCSTFNRGLSLIRQNNTFNWLHLTNVKTEAQNEARGFCETPQTLWIANVMGIARYDLESQTYSRLLEEQSGFLTITADKQGYVWAGGYGIGIFRINTKTNQVEQIKTVDGNEEPDRIFTLYCDDDGDVWVGGLNIRLTRIKPDGTRQHYDAGQVFSLCSIDSDRLLAGTSWGFYVVNKRTGKVDVYQNDPARMKWDGCNKYNGVTATDGHLLWLASEGGGLVCYDLNTDELKAFTVDDGLPSNYLTAVAYDGHDHLWVSTESNGLFAFDIHKFHVSSRIHQYNGIPINSFYPNAAMRLHDGQVVIGGDAGSILFNPSDITTPDKQLNIYFTRLLVGEKDVNMVANPEIIASPINQAMRVELPNDQRSMSVDVCVSDIYNQTDMRLRYRLDGYIDEWKDVAPSGRISFVMLPPGHYNLELAVTMPGEDDIVMRRLSIFVEQPFYLRWYMLCLYALLFALFVAGLFFYLRRYVRKQ